MIELRDILAGLALNGLIQVGSQPEEFDGQFDTGHEHDDGGELCPDCVDERGRSGIAVEAYKLADAMLLAREATREPQKES